MNLRHTISMIFMTMLMAGMCTVAIGQNKGGNANSRKGFDRIPDRYRAQIRALGKRASESGKEKTIYTGQLFDKAGKSTPVRIIHQLPNLVRLEGFKAGNAHLSFDGERATGADSRKDELYLEAFVMDMAEGLLSSIQSSAAIRLLGEGFGPDPRVEPNYKGPRFDIYDVTDTVRCRRKPLLRAKRYHLDSKTGLLLSTRYYDRTAKPAIKIENHFSMWGSIDGSAYPARIDHYVGGELEFTFVAEEITAELSTDVEDFR